MPAKKATKTTESVAETTPVAAAPVVEVATKEKKPRASKAKATTEAAAPAKVEAAAPVVEVEAPVTANPVEDIETSLSTMSAEFLTKLSQLSNMISSLKNDYRVLEKRMSREMKAAQKAKAKGKRKAGSRPASGFVKPTKISDELASFLGKDKGTEMARTDVTREINNYIRSHNLQDKENGRKINPDVKLSTLLKLKKTDELTYFNLQRYMSPHFAKASAAAAPTTA
jgi:chromatin remodeling complex protein RSC6